MLNHTHTLQSGAAQFIFASHCLQLLLSLCWFPIQFPVLTMHVCVVVVPSRDRPPDRRVGIGGERVGDLEGAGECDEEKG